MLSAFILANTATILTHTPGGLGVIETVVLLVLQRPDLIGAVLLFRFVYFLLPLCLGAVLFAVVELRWRFGGREAEAAAKHLIAAGVARRARQGGAAHADR